MPSPPFDGLLIIAVLMTAVWAWSVRVADASVVDAWWGPGFVVLTVCAVLESPVLTSRAVLAWVLVTLWAVRLSWHLVTRNRGTGEDPRYAAMRAHQGGAFWWRSLFTVFLLQAAALWVVALPLWAAVSATAPTTLTWIDGLGVVLFAVGFGFEVIGDWQLVRFKRDPANKGHVLDTGLWRYTRHPNYFGDALLWWGLGALGAATGAWWSLVGPLLMTALLLNVSGVPLLERNLAATKPGYRAYVERTSAFVPWRPRR